MVRLVGSPWSLKLQTLLSELFWSLCKFVFWIFFVHNLTPVNLKMIGFNQIIIIKKQTFKTPVNISD